MSIKTIKLPYSCKDEDRNAIISYIRNYNSVLRFTYNRLYDSEFKLSTKELTKLQKQMNNVILDSHFLNCAQQEAKQLKGRKRVIFGGKNNFIQRCQNKISKEEFQNKRIQPLYSIGIAAEHSNRKFRIQNDHEIIFQPDRKHQFLLTLPKLRKNYKKILNELKVLQDDSKIAISYKMDIDNICIIFDNNEIEQMQSYSIKDRIFAVDLNPNYIGWSVVDWIDSENYELIDAGVVSNKSLNDDEIIIHKASNSKERKYLSNKKRFENIDTAKYLFNIATHYKCSIFSLEKLEIPVKDAKRGKRYNRLVNNQWNRNIFYLQIRKRCDIYGIHYQEVVANYSSFEGNLIYRGTNLPDMCLSSIELGRRGYEFYHQYVLKDKPKTQNIMFDTSRNAIIRIQQSLEELKYFENFESIKQLYIKLKTLDVKYRVPLEGSILQAVFSKKSIKSKILLYGHQ